MVGWAWDLISMAADAKSNNALSLHEELARRYFREVLVEGKVEIVDKMVTRDELSIILQFRLLEPAVV